jgi:formylglycine-generating enzyme required for sulfatase activity
MVGNNAEWVNDRYIKSAYSLTGFEVVDPMGPTELEQKRFLSYSGFRGVRGTLFTGSAVAETVCRNAWRIGFPKESSLNNLGFRIVANV